LVGSVYVQIPSPLIAFPMEFNIDWLMIGVDKLVGVDAPRLYVTKALIE
jgi:hypothetical protein